MATLSPLSYSRLQTPTGSTSDISDCASQSSEYGYSALHGAVISNDVEYLGFLLGSGCERLDQRDENGFTALHVATLQKSINGAQRLIKAGCDIEKPTKVQRTANLDCHSAFLDLSQILVARESNARNVVCARFMCLPRGFVGSIHGAPW